MTIARLNALLRPFIAVGFLSLAALLPLQAAAGHFPWDQGHDSTTPGDPPPPGTDPCGDPCNGGATASPVYAALGYTIWANTDIDLRGRPRMRLERTYASNEPSAGLFGNGWTTDLDIALYPAHSGGNKLRILRMSTGKRYVYTMQSDGSYASPPTRFDTVVEESTRVTMRMSDGRRHVFGLDGRLLERYDVEGNRITYTHDAYGRPQRMADDTGRSLTFSYNGSGFVDRVTDHTGRNWVYKYDGNGNLIAVIDPLQGQLRYAYQSYRPPGDAHTYSQLLSVTDPSGVKQVQYTYNGNAVASYTEGQNTYTYNRSTPGVFTKRDVAYATTTHYYGSNGLVSSERDAMGFTTSYVYDANGQVTRKTDGNGQVWINEYDAQGRLTAEQNPLGQRTTYAYTGNEPQPRTTTSPTGRVSTATYNAAFQVLTETDTGGAVTTRQYTAKGDLRKLRNALGQETTYLYNARGLMTQITDPSGRVSKFSYDSLGRPVTLTNASNETTTIEYDALDRMTKSTDHAGRVTAVSYDAAGRMLKLTDAKGSVTEFRYDAYGRRTHEVAPDGRATVYAYNSDNTLSSTTWPDGTYIQNYYNANKQVTQRYAGEYTYFTYDGVGRMLTATGAGGDVVYTYDAAGRIATESSGGQLLTHTRNGEGERTRLDVLGQTLQYTRDNRGGIQQITGPAGTIAIGADALGRRSQLTYPGGSTEQYTYDAAGQFTGVTHVGALNATYGFQRDAAGRVQRITGDGADWNYSYDGSGRLTTATQGSTVYDYTTDGVGNITADGRLHDINHRLLSDATYNYSYDQRGNLTLKQNRGTGAREIYTWSNSNQLKKLDFYPTAAGATPNRTISYTYDATGRRTTKTDAGVTERYVYDGDNRVATLDASNALLSLQTFSDSIDNLLATTAAGTTRVIHHGGPVNNTVGVSEGGTLTQSYRYGAYGETLPGSSADSVPFRYTGREKDTDTLYYYRNRYYDTGMKRFISADPAGLLGGIHPYAYVGGDPLGYIDPFGLSRGNPEMHPSNCCSGGKGACNRRCDSKIDQCIILLGLLAGVICGKGYMPVACATLIYILCTQMDRDCRKQCEQCP